MSLARSTLASVSSGTLRLAISNIGRSTPSTLPMPLSTTESVLANDFPATGRIPYGCVPMRSSGSGPPGRR